MSKEESAPNRARERRDGLNRCGYKGPSGVKRWVGTRQPDQYRPRFRSCSQALKPWPPLARPVCL
jgi:hypothetical protein